MHKVGEDGRQSLRRKVVVSHGPIIQRFVRFTAASCSARLSGAEDRGVGVLSTTRRALRFCTARLCPATEPASRIDDQTRKSYGVADTIVKTRPLGAMK